MPTVQSLKKKLQVILSTRKLTKAMKTASTVKYSKLSALYVSYEKYEKQCSMLYDTCRSGFNSLFALENENDPVCYIVLTSNKGMCGSFNTELLGFFSEILKEEEKAVILSCGKKGREFFEKNSIGCEKYYVFDDVPSYAQAKELSEDLIGLMKAGRVSAVKTVYPEYVNMMKQKPVCRDLFTLQPTQEGEDDSLFVPDRETVIKNSAEKVLSSILYKRILETALGAQAATLTTMRSAYDTACEYSVQLEAEINRKRQSQVTADVVEVSAEYAMEREE